MFPACGRLAVRLPAVGSAVSRAVAQRSQVSRIPIRCCASEPVHSPAIATHSVQTFAPVPSGVEDAQFAVIRILGRQFKVTPGDVVVADRMKVEVGSQIEVEDVLLVGSRERTVVGRPTIPDAKVVLSVEEHAKDEKVIVFKKKRRQGYKRKQGHRRQLTMLRVDDIVLSQ